MEEIMQILKDLDWSPLFISLKTGVVATFISFFLKAWPDDSPTFSNRAEARPRMTKPFWAH